MKFTEFGKYTIIKKLASGGMADILLACDLSPAGFGRFVVIKRALSKFSENEEFKDMFKNEGKVANSLKHSNITPIYEFGIQKDQFFLCMEYISGRNVRELIKKLQLYKSSISIPNAVYIIKEVASGLNYAHNAVDPNTGRPLNLIHRDISPQNIMLSFDGEVKLIDFGIAKIADTNLTRVGHLKGKFSYMSPEQAKGEPLDARTDIFCMGIILWELLTGKRLFASSNDLNSLKKVKVCDVPSAQKINPEIPTALNHVIQKALSKNKNSRYKSAANMEQDLTVFLNKNYPEYSRYEFISLIKKVYRKEIMKEREDLKTYSSKFNIYKNERNKEEGLSPQTQHLSIPDISILDPAPKAPTETKSWLNEEENRSYNSQFITQTKKTKSFTNSQEKEENSSTLIQRQDFKTETSANDQTLSRSLTDETRQPQLVAKNNDSIQLKMESQYKMAKTQSPPFNQGTLNTDLSFKKATALYDKKKFIEQIAENKDENQTSLFFLIMASVLFLGGGSFAIFWLIKNDNVMEWLGAGGGTSPPSVQQGLPKSIPAPHSAEKAFANKQITNPPAQRKIFINSKPSGAAIFVNGQFLSKYTPSVVSLSAKSISHITIKKEGYFPKKTVFNPQNQSQSSLSVSLRADPQRDLSSEKTYIRQ